MAALQASLPPLVLMLHTSLGLSLALVCPKLVRPLAGDIREAVPLHDGCRVAEEVAKPPDEDVAQPHADNPLDLSDLGYMMTKILVPTQILAQSTIAPYALVGGMFKLAACRLLTPHAVVAAVTLAVSVIS